MDVPVIYSDYNAECNLCVHPLFRTPEDFANHLRINHCSREGGSFVCLYGENRVCSSLPVEGISDADYEQHIYKHHVFVRNKYHRHKRQITNMSSVSDISVDNDKWNVYSASQNLAAVLNNPNKMKQKDFFTKVWGESFVELVHIPDPHFLPTISKQHFEPYLKKLLKRYRRRAKLKKRASDGLIATEVNHNFPSLKSKATETVTYDIPDIFLKTKFDLSNPETFNYVFPCISECIKRPGNSGNDSASMSSPSNKPTQLQERLSLYLDTVEVQIAKQVSSKSDAFFHTMTSHDALMENLTQTINKVRTLRQRIQSIDSSLVKESLKILKGIRSRNNYYLVLRKLRIMATVYQTQPTVKLLLSTPDYVAALDLIYTTKDLLNNELAGIQCFRHLSSELNEVIKMIDALMTGELERYATADLNRPLLESETHTREKDKLLCIIMGMLRRQSFSFVESYWKESYAAIKATIKQAVIEIVAESDSPVFRHSNEQSCDALTLDEQLKMLTIEEWISLLRSTAKALKFLLERIKNAYDIMMKAVHICSDNDVADTRENNSHNCQRENDIIGNEIECCLDEESKNIICNKLLHMISSACQYVCERYAHLLSKRSLTDEAEQKKGRTPNKSPTVNNNSWLAEQATLAQLNEVSSYVDDLCAVCRKLNPDDSNYIALKSAFKAEATKFMKKFHEERLRKIDMILENETWKPTQVPVEFQFLVNQITAQGKFTTYKVDKNSRNENKPADILYIDNEKFVVIGTVLLLINVIAEYCVRAEEITLSAKCLLRYLADLLQLFNRKSCKLVLGGEAVSEKTGLKKITSSNLALLMRALQLLLRLIPLIRTHFSSLLPVNPSLTISHLDRVSDELQSHIVDIRKKLLSISTQIIVTELKNWEAKPPVPSKSFLNLSKNLKKLHEVVSVVLEKEDTYDLYRRINDNFKEVLRERIVRMNIVNNGGPQHGIVITELIFYLQDLKKVGALPENELDESCMNDLWTQ